MTSLPPRRPSPSPSPQWIAAIVGFMLGIVAAAIVVAVGAGGESGRSVLGVLFVAVVAISALMLFVLRRSPVWFRLVWVTVFSLFLMGTGALGVAIQRRMAAERELNTVVQNMPRELQEAMAAIQQGKPLPKRPPLVRPERDADYAMAIYLTKSTVYARIDNQQRYMDDLKAVDWERLLEPAEYHRPDSRERARARVAGALKALDTRIEREHAVTRTFVEGMRKADLPAGFRSGFEQRASEIDINREIDELAASERKAIQAASRVSEVLLDHPWQRQGNDLMFETDTGLYAFRAAQAALDAAIRDSEARDRRTERKVQDLREELEKAKL